MSFSYKLEEIGPRVGLIVLQADETLEGDARRMLPLELGLHVSRVPSGDDVTGDTLAQMAHDLPAAAGLLPKAAQYSVIGYGCTSGTSVIGADTVVGLVRQGHAADTVTNPVTALIAACAELGVRRIALLSPYVAEVSETLRRVLDAAGIETPVFASFDEGEEAKVVRIAPASIIAAVQKMAVQDVDAVFLSCTNLRTLDVIDPLEAMLGKPVLSSNQVLLWHMARLAGLPATGPGQLLQRA
jgi:maleate isomerase